MSWKSIQMSTFLHFRAERFKPNDPAIKGLQRIEKIDFSGNIYISDKPSNTDMIVVKKGDLVISGINVAKGAMAVYQGDEDITATIHYSSYSYDEHKIDLQFLKNFLKSPEFSDALKEQIPGGIKTEIKPKHILPLRILIPTDITEQRKLVKELEYKNRFVNHLSTELTHQLELLKQLRQAFLREAMQGKLTAAWRAENPDTEPASQLLARIKAEKEKLVKEGKLKKQKSLPPIKEEEIPFEIPEEWVWCRLGEICNELLGGFAFKSSKYVKASENQVIRLGNVKPNYLSLESNPVFIDDRYAQQANKSKLLPNDILITMTGTRAKRDYLFTLILKDDDFEDQQLYLNQRVGSFRFNRLVSSFFLNYLLKEKTILYPVFESSTGAANQANIGVTALNNILIPLPAYSEQHFIVTKLDELMHLCDQIEASIKTSQQQNELLLQQVLREALSG